MAVPIDPKVAPAHKPAPHAIKGTSSQGATEKKWIAWLIADLTWTGIIGAGMWKYGELSSLNATVVLLAMIVVKGVVEVGYILGQAGLDALTALFDTITPDSIFGMGKKVKKPVTEDEPEPEDPPTQPPTGIPPTGN